MNISKNNQAKDSFWVNLGGPKSNINLSTKQQQNNFLFEIILLKSILYYKFEKGLVEINIKKNDFSSLSDYFYIYYETDVIDLLILEMIESEIDFENRIPDFRMLL